MTDLLKLKLKRQQLICSKNHLGTDIFKLKKKKTNHDPTSESMAFKKTLFHYFLSR